MKKKKRKWIRKKVRAVTESSALHRICELFIYPLIKLRPEHIGYREWTEALFCLDTRHIIRYHVIENFTMPGYYYRTPNILAPFAGKRAARNGMHLWLRYDTTMPETLDVELTGRGKKAQVFKLSTVQWGYIKQFISPAPFKSDLKERKIK